ncbi:hypothetical protein KBC04_04375 [Candidatus Babeliales bacterium]|nr:hypothetical protein [Candidatus Babeliales bacterium]MBP9844302.1 hypothetical protein [Candidatus Babeliales bacterium]
MQQKFQKIKTNFLLFLELQLLISLVICPMLIAWGLPISMMSIVGNLIFAQFLTVFIFLSALLFSSDILGIPNYFIAQALEWVTQIWHYLLSFGTADWLVGFPLWIFPISLIFAATGCFIYKIKMSQNYRILTLGILCLAIPTIHTIFQAQSALITVQQGLQKMHLIKARGKVYAFDCGALGARPSSLSWIEYTLIPTVIKAIGATHIDALILCKSNSRTAQAAKECMKCLPTGQLIEIHNKHETPKISST